MRSSKTGIFDLKNFAERAFCLFFAVPKLY